MEALGSKAGGPCVEVDLPSGTSPAWWLPVSEAPGAMGPRINVTGIVKDQQFSPSAVEAHSAAVPANEPALPVDLPLSDLVSARTFGSEERVSIASRTDAGLAISCRSGTSTAGVLLVPVAGRLPAGAQAELRILARGDVGFQWGVAGPDQDAALLRPIAATSHAGLSASIPLGDAVASLSGDRASFVLLCPLHAATLLVRSIDLYPVPPAVQRPGAAWVWSSGRWRADPAVLIADAAALGLRRLYVALSMDPEHTKVADAALLAEFISMAAAKGIAIWAVEGDPGMATPEGRGLALQRLHALRNYQADVAPAARLGGIQYDIEPYLLPAYRADPLAVAGQWAQTMQALRQHTDMELDMVLPFWLLQSPMGDTVQAALKESADSLTIMAYRTEPQAIQQVAEPLLSWGTAQGVPVHVGLEAGFLDDELTQFYSEVPVGQAAQLWLLPTDGGAAAVLLSRSALLTQGKGYNALGQQLAPATKVSFLGDKARMLTVAQQLQPALAAWNSYTGMVFHGLLD